MKTKTQHEPTLDEQIAWLQSVPPMKLASILMSEYDWKGLLKSLERLLEEMQRDADSAARTSVWEHHGNLADVALEHLRPLNRNLAKVGN